MVSLKNKSITSLKEKHWKTFKLNDIFEIENCKCSNVSNLKNGNVPYLGASNRNNGVLNFVEGKVDLLTKGQCIVFICDGEGSIGYSIYQESDFIGSTTLKVGRNPYINRYHTLFISNISDKVRTKYNFGYKRSTFHLKNESLMLPINAEGEPDWNFMENYIKQIEDTQKEKYKAFALKKLQDLEYKEIPKLKEKQWQAFEIQGLFDIKIGRNVDGNKVDKNNGKFAYITRKENNNGIDGFLNYENSYFNKDFPVITIGNETAKPYVQVYPFFTGTKVNILKPKTPLSYYCLGFISQSLEMHKNKYSYSFTINSKRLKNQKVLLPINLNDEPDYKYMEQYIKNVMYRQLSDYLIKCE